jgi:hypothetical protein
MNARSNSRLRPGREGALAWAILINTELLLVGVYLLWTGVAPIRPLFYVYPFVWINAALWALWTVDAPGGSSRRRRAVAAAVGAGYFLVLGYFGGLVGPGSGGFASGWSLVVASFPPGWSPAVLYNGESLTLALLPFKLFGYATLAYLVALTVRDATGGATAGLLGVFSCVSCTLPLIAGAVGGFVGGAGALVTAAYGQSYGLSTLVFVVTVALLVWRPTAADLSRMRTKLGP